MGEEGHDLAPLVRGLRPAVQQDDRIAGTLDDHVQVDPRETPVAALRAAQTTAPSCSSRRSFFAGRTNCARSTPSHITSGLATSTDDEMPKQMRIVSAPAK